jgi:hypothetical protein
MAPRNPQLERYVSTDAQAGLRDERHPINPRNDRIVLAVHLHTGAGVRVCLDSAPPGDHSKDDADDEPAPWSVTTPHGSPRPLS